MSDTPDRPSFYRVPVLGPIAREWAEGDRDFPFVLILAVVLAWACALLIFGLPALTVPAVALAFGMLAMLVALTRG